MKKTDLAWAAGLFEGEGCFSIKKGRVRLDGRRKLYAYLSMNSTDLDVLERLVQVLGGSIRDYRRGDTPLVLEIKTLKRSWQWNLNGDKGVAAGERLRPWLCSRRRAAFDKMKKLHGTYEPTC